MVVGTWSELLTCMRYEASPFLLFPAVSPFSAPHPLSPVPLDSSWTAPAGEPGARACVAHGGLSALSGHRPGSSGVPSAGRRACMNPGSAGLRGCMHCTHASITHSKQCPPRKHRGRPTFTCYLGEGRGEDGAQEAPGPGCWGRIMMTLPEALFWFGLFCSKHYNLARLPLY